MLSRRSRTGTTADNKPPGASGESAEERALLSEEPLRAGPSARTVHAQWYLFVPEAGVQRGQSAGHFGLITGDRFTALPIAPVYRPPTAVAIP